MAPPSPPRGQSLPAATWPSSLALRRAATVSFVEAIGATSHAGYAPHHAASHHLRAQVRGSMPTEAVGSAFGSHETSTDQFGQPRDTHEAERRNRPVIIGVTLGKATSTCHVRSTTRRSRSATRSTTALARVSEPFLGLLSRGAILGAIAIRFGLTSSHCAIDAPCPATSRHQ